MIELIVATYGTLCWLVFKKFKLVPVTTYTVCTAILGGIGILFLLMVLLSICHPVSHDGTLYSVVTQVTPQVRGRIIEVPVEGNTPLREGDVLFQIDSAPYKLEVERLEARLAGMNAEAAQIDARLASAQAATEAARSNLLVSESDFDRQARISLESAQAQIAQVESRLTLAKENLARSEKLSKTGAVSQRDLDSDIASVDALEAELSQARSAEKSAEEKMRSGSDRLKAARDNLKQAEAAETEARIARDAEIDGLNPDVAQAMAELDHKRWELEQTTVRAPSDGFVTYVSVRPGQMATPFNLSAAILFVPAEEPTLVATFPQTSLGAVEPGLEAEVAFKTHPGEVFKARVVRVMPIMPEGQFVNAGRLQNTSTTQGRVPVLFEYDEDVEQLNLPTGTQASVAIYTHELHALSILRKIVLRMKSWENYAFFMSGFDAVH